MIYYILTCSYILNITSLYIMIQYYQMHLTNSSINE